jgi:hypothetical protein
MTPFDDVLEDLVDCPAGFTYCLTYSPTDRPGKLETLQPAHMDSAVLFPVDRDPARHQGRKDPLQVLSEDAVQDFRIAQLDDFDRQESGQKQQET